MVKKDEMLAALQKYAKDEQLAQQDWPGLGLEIMPEAESPESQVQRVKQFRMMAPILALAGQFDRRGWTSVRLKRDRGPYLLANDAVNKLTIAHKLFSLPHREEIPRAWGLMTAALEQGFEEGFRGAKVKKMTREVPLTNNKGQQRFKKKMQQDPDTGKISIIRIVETREETYQVPVGGNIEEVDLAVSENIDSLWEALISAAKWPTGLVPDTLDSVFSKNSNQLPFPEEGE